MPRLRYLTGVALALLAALASAQTYKWTDPKTGRTVFSDQPPPAGIKSRQQGQAVPLDGRATDALPYAVREAAREFPVTLFTAEKCGPECTQARQLLTGRGIPFRETLVASPEQVEDLKRISGQAGVPVLRVGQQVSSGLETGAWNRLLDLAGYPQSAPAGYRAPAQPAQPAPPPAADR
jgi:glutaredoxin